MTVSTPSHRRLLRPTGDGVLSASGGVLSPETAQNKAVRDFSFANHAGGFDQHIEPSIPGYERLRDDWCIGLSRQFVQNGTRVVDVGCSTGMLLSSIREANQVARPSVRYLGIDAERAFAEHWRQRRTHNLRFQVCDARSFTFENVSLAYSLFTLQFIPEGHRLGLLRRIYAGLNEGGALIIAEKVLASSAYFQDILTFNYYDFKLRTFTPDQILDKQRSLRGQMILWEEARWESALCGVGFQIQRFWHDGPFAAWLAVKDTSRSPGWPLHVRPVSPAVILRSGMPFELVMDGLDSSLWRLELTTNADHGGHRFP
jgi:tRNA (cmo5U34)-methyltransferase